VDESDLRIRNRLYASFVQDELALRLWSDRPARDECVPQLRPQLRELGVGLNAERIEGLLKKQRTAAAATMSKISASERPSSRSSPTEQLDESHGHSFLRQR
jgi:hypothetical protein